MVIKTIDRTYDLLSESNNGRLTLTQPIYRDDTEQLIHVSEKVCSIKSGFQSIEIVDTEEYGRSMIIDGIMQTSEKDHHIYDQAILEKLTQNDKEIIILGGGDGYVAETALSMNPNLKITIVDLDVEVVAAAKKYLKQKIFNHPNVTLFIGDALHYLHTRQGEKVDGIISDLTDNPTIKLEENFTEDFKKFFSKVLPLIKKNLKNDGWVTIQCGAAKVTEKYLDTASIIEDVVRMHFSNVSRASVLIPSYGEDNCFISAMHSEHE